MRPAGRKPDQGADDANLAWQRVAVEAAAQLAVHEPVGDLGWSDGQVAQQLGGRMVVVSVQQRVRILRGGERLG